MGDYIAVKEKYAKYLPHSAGRYAAKRFRKAQCPIVERLCNSLMMHGRNNGKKLLTVRIVKHAFEIIHLLTGENPLQVVVNAIINSGPREDSTRIGRAGTVRRQASPTSSSMLPRAPPTATLSRRRMNWSVLPSPTDKHGPFGSDGGFRDAFNPEPSLKKRNYLLLHAKLPTIGKCFSLAETFSCPT